MLSYLRGGESLLFKAKLFAMVVLIVVDIGLNSSVEHDGLGITNQATVTATNGTVLALILG